MIRKGVIRAFDPGSYTATVQMAGSLSVWLSDIRVARNVAVGEVVAGRRCAVLFFDDSNHRDAVLFDVYS